MARPRRTHKRVRLNLEVSMAVRRQIETLRDKSEADTLTETVRRALRAYEVLLGYREAGAHILLRAPDGAEQELAL